MKAPSYIETVRLSEDGGALLILDQTRLPGEEVVLRLTTREEIFEAIYLLKVRGAPAIGVAAAMGICLLAGNIDTEEYAAFAAEFGRLKDYLASSRPTAVNLFWALRRMEGVVGANSDKPVATIKRLLKEEAAAIRAEDERVCKSIGEHALTLIEDGAGILTHCNAGRLATSRYGTALAAIHLGLERGMRFRVYTDETRPLLQGARLSAYELAKAGADTTLICDNMASVVMKNGWIDAVFVGCDRVAANGDAANKIGTSGVAILAKHYGIPFYVCAPTSTIDIACKCGADIIIEERPAEEVTEMWYQRRMAPQGIKVYNPAFDVTDHTLITAIITEHGLMRAPFDRAITELFHRK